MRIDMHTHSHYSKDGVMPPKELIKRARMVGLDGMAITDHNSRGGGIVGSDIARDMEDFIVIPGIELSTDMGHLIVLDPKTDFPKPLTLLKALEIIKEEGLVSILPHPNRGLNGIKPIEEEPLEVEGIETCNARSSKSQNRRASHFADLWKKARIGGSDAHLAAEVGYGVTIIEGDLEEPDEILEAIRGIKTEAECHSIPLPTRVYENSRLFAGWIRRGFRRI